MITDETALRALYGEPGEHAKNKQITGIDAHCVKFLSLSPFLLLATSDGVRQDVSPKGDAPGFVQVEDDRAVLIPDWPGNNRLDGYTNILKNPQAGLLFLIPGMKETLRINGRASIHDEVSLRARFETRGRLPITVLRVSADEVFLHCAKSVLRSQLWSPETWPEKGALPKPGDIFRDHMKLPADFEIPEGDEMYREYRLY